MWWISVGIVLSAVTVLGLILCWRTRSALIALSADYAYSDPPTDSLIGKQSVVIGGMVLPGCFLLGRTTEGLILVPGALLSALGTGALRIPWSAISVERTGRLWCTVQVGRLWLSAERSVLLPPVEESGPV